MTSIVRRPTRSLLPRLLAPEMDRLFGDFFLEPSSLLPAIAPAPLWGVLREDIDLTAEDGGI